MNREELISLVQMIVAEAKELSDKHTTEKSAPVNYACVFSQSSEEFETLLPLAHVLGSVVEDTKMGPVFQIKPIDTVAGKLELLKIRKPDQKRVERGDADFTVTNYSEFKKMYLRQPGFNLIVRENMEMIELADPAFNVLTYFSNPILFDVLMLKHI